MGTTRINETKRLKDEDKSIVQLLFIYCTPYIQETFDYVIRQDSYALIYQCRVNPKQIKVCDNKVYWVINQSKNIRPYGIILIKQDMINDYPKVKDQFQKKFDYADYKDQIQRYTNSY